jgi:hypothetical protein
MRILIICLLAALACSRGKSPQPATPQPQPPKRATQPAVRPLTGSYRFTAVNKSRVPAEFPPGSGARLESGSLELQTNNRFVMRFGAKTKGATEVKTSAEEGRYRIGRDTLYFLVEGRESQPPVTFKFARTSNGLRLVDRNGNEWTYVRR